MHTQHVRAVRGSAMGLALLVLVAVAGTSAAGPVFYTKLSEESAACNACHKEQSAGIVQQWGSSKHYRGNVGCFECHAAKAGEFPAWAARIGYGSSPPPRTVGPLSWRSRRTRCRTCNSFT